MASLKGDNGVVHTWEDFCATRLEYLNALAEVVEAGEKRKDTTHPVFCGCIDWHSSVHGTYALLAASRLTGNPRWVEVAESILNADCLADELRSLQRGELDHELPYGYAWFLKLAQERERWCEKTDLLPLAIEIAQRLEDWVFSLSDEKIVHNTLRREYGNLSWALLNLWDWSEWKGNSRLTEKLESFTREQLLSFDRHLSSSYDDYTDEFFAASLQRTRVILSILPEEEAQAWLHSFCKERLLLEPVQTAPQPHSGGLNFSRSWGFWALYESTGDTEYQDMYVNHIVKHMESPQFWRDDYKKYGHWVPQFGIYAIALSMNEEVL